VDNYFQYFSEVEEHFLQRRGAPLIGSTLDWAQIEIWKNAGIPLEAVLRGIDTAFDKYEQRKSKRHEKINSILWCAQAVLSAAEDMKEAAVGTAHTSSPSAKSGAGQGFEPEAIAAFLRRNADLLKAAKLPQSAGVSVHAVAEESATTLRKLAVETESRRSAARLEDLERHLTVLEEKLFAALLAATPDQEIVTVRAQADRELAPYRSKMVAAQIGQLQKQYIHKRLLEKYGLPRLSLFYM
jgi:nitrogen fixation protein FixH